MPHVQTPSQSYIGVRKLASVRAPKQSTRIATSIRSNSVKGSRGVSRVQRHRQNCERETRRSRNTIAATTTMPPTTTGTWTRSPIKESRKSGMPSTPHSQRPAVRQALKTEVILRFRFEPVEYNHPGGQNDQDRERYDN